MAALQPAWAGEVTVAVAANFLTTAQKLGPVFEEQTGHRVVLVGGSTGRLTAQILQGAPFDTFLSADTAHPTRLLADGKAVAQHPYAVGRLVLVGPSGMPDDWNTALSQAAEGPVALANPALAPYGAAAAAAFADAGLSSGNQIMGDSVGQVAAFIASGNVDYGLLALAQLRDGLDDPARFAYVEAPGSGNLLEQSAALIRDTPAARAFFDWIASPQAAPIIRAAGYILPRPAP